MKITKAIARHSKIRDKNRSLGKICPGEPHERSPNAPKFEDRSLEETEWQEQGAHEAAWKVAKNVLKLKEHERATPFSSPENRCSYEWVNGQKPHLIEDGIRIFCHTENFVPIVVPGLSSSSSTSSSSSRTPLKQESHSSSSSSSSPSSPTVGDLSVREKEDVTDSDISPVPASELVDDRTEEPVETQANKILQPKRKGNHDRTGLPV